MCPYKWAIQNFTQIQPLELAIKIWVIKLPVCLKIASDKLSK
ncbi:hypothetical protein HPS12939_1442 [Glaesserella parasuis 12939]|nr:hypothetical protein HPS12939_1442 [Glaesserella parasuis 12939]EQA09029.1 hypothetical protein HPSD74_1561 [Glaesserella parasuis D74]EQA12829.1 hypothetical protein HPS174_1022 [Glaesserella parasuis 174]